MQLGRPGLALRRGQPTALTALARNERCCLLLKSFKRANLGPKPPGIWRMSANKVTFIKGNLLIDVLFLVGTYTSSVFLS